MNKPMDTLLVDDQFFSEAKFRYDGKVAVLSTSQLLEPEATTSECHNWFKAIESSLIVVTRPENCIDGLIRSHATRGAFPNQIMALDIKNKDEFESTDILAPTEANARRFRILKERFDPSVQGQQAEEIPEVKPVKIAARISRSNDVDDIPLPDEKPWPVIDQAAFQGLAGEIVTTIGPECEADPVGLLATILTSYGNACGPGPFFPVGPTKHRSNLFCALVGQSAKARKGTSGDLCEALFNQADPDWVLHHRVSGLATGEGIGWLARDTDDEKPSDEKPKYSKMQKALGERPKLAEDKRLFIDEPEFGQVLQNANRQGNNLSQVIRKLWDGKKLEFVSKATPFSATGLHGSISAHVTLNELKHLLGATETTNGFCNRFIWLCVKRSKLLPFGGNLAELPSFGKRLAQGLMESRRVARMKFSASAGKLWEEAYHGELSQEDEGVVGDVVSRAEAQALRLAMVYALVGESDVIERDHLGAALALWRYARESAHFIFGGTQSGLPGKILTLLQAAGGNGLTRKEISGGLSRNYPAAKIVEALAQLKRTGQAAMELLRNETARRPTELWRHQGP